MKDKILFFIIGLLVGAIITASGFLIFGKINKNTNKAMLDNRKIQAYEMRDKENTLKKSNNFEKKEKNSENSKKNENRQNKQNKQENPQSQSKEL